MCCKVFFKTVHAELWEQLTLRSITLLSSLVSWLTVALPSWGKTKTNHHLWNIHQSNQLLHTHNWQQLTARVHKLIHFRPFLLWIDLVASHPTYVCSCCNTILCRQRQWTNKKKQWEKCFNCRRYCRFQGHTCGASSEDSLGLELMACISTSCSKQPHTQVQKVRQADSEIDGAVKACFSQESRYCYKCVTDMLNPHRKQRGCCCRLPSWTNTDQLICQQVKSLPLLENGFNMTKKVDRGRGMIRLLYL